MQDTQHFSPLIPLNESLFASSTFERYNSDYLNFFPIEGYQYFNKEENYDQNPDSFNNKQIQEFENNKQYDDKNDNFFLSFHRNIKINQTLKLIQKRVKTPRIYCAQFRRKKINMINLNVEEVKLFDEALLFGNLIIMITID
ncbi:hypothetical protein ABPG72_016615 [Tetrahymena utriculariae]